MRLISRSYYGQYQMWLWIITYTINIVHNVTIILATLTANQYTQSTTESGPYFCKLPIQLTNINDITGKLATTCYYASKMDRNWYTNGMGLKVSRWKEFIYRMDERKWWWQLRIRWSPSGWQLIYIWRTYTFLIEC